MTERLILLAKAPVLGRVKTRLVPPLSPERALALHEAFLADQLAFVRGLASASRSVELCLDRRPGEPGVEPEPPVELTHQGPGDLGDRMLRAFVRASARGARRTVIVAADAPTLPALLVTEAFSRLAGGAPVVVSPADDGGYVMLGAAVPPAPLLGDIPWGASTVLSVTRLRARASGLAMVEIDGWYDVDTASDLERLARDLSADPSRAPATARWLAAWRAGGLGPEVSVI